MSEFKIRLGIDFADGELKSLKNKINNTQFSKIKLELNTKKVDSQLNSIRKQIQNLNNIKVNLGTGVSSGSGTQKAIKELTQLERKVTSSQSKIKSIKLRVDTGTLKNDLSKAETSFNKISASSEKLERSMNELRAAKLALETARGTGDEIADINKLISANERYEKALKDVNNQLQIASRNQKTASNEKNLDLKKTALSSDIDKWLKDNSAAANEFGAKLKDIQARIKSCDASGLRNLRAEFTNIKKQADLAGKATQTLGDRLKTQFQRYSSYFSVASAFMYVTQGLKDMFDQVVAIDSAMTELKKVTDETKATYNDFLTNASQRATEIGTTIDGLVSSTADFARLGYEFKDAAGLAEVANIYTVVGDEIDSVDTATQSVISTMKAFKVEAADSMSIVDKFNEVSNNFAISSGGIGEALTRSASSLAAANNSLDESIALITASNTVVQDPTVVGTALKTVSMRIRGAKTEMEEAGLETDGMAESTAKLQAELKALSGVDIMLDKDTFKSTYQIMEELAAKWEDLTDIQQASVTELIAGKRQGNIISSLMTNFDVAQDALETSLGSEGSAMKEHEKWMESLEAKLLQLKAAWQGLSQAFMSSDFLKGALDVLIDFLEILTKLIDELGVIPTLVGGFASFKILKTLVGVGGISELTDMLSLLSLSFPKAAKGASIFTTALKSGTGAATGASKGIGSLVFDLAKAHPVALAVTAGITLLAGAFIKAKKDAEELSEKVNEITSKYKEQHDTLMNAKGNYDTSNEDSMISRYEKLSKGVDSVGNNISLTADEYAEYQSIVGEIANQIPELVTGFNSQGTAILSCAGDVDTLTEAYKNLIIETNKEVLDTGDNIFKDFKNKLDEAIGSQSEANMNLYSMEALENILSSENLEETISKELGKSSDSERRIAKLLEENGFERDVLGSGEKGWETNREFITRAIKEDSDAVKAALGDSIKDIDSYAEGLNTLVDAYFSTEFLTDYSNMSDEMQAVIKQFASNFDASFYNQFSSADDLTEHLDTMLEAFNKLDYADAKEIETIFSLQTKFNNGEISYGEYVTSLNSAGKTIDELVSKGALDSDIASDIKLNLGLNDENVVEDYRSLLNRLTSEEYGIKIDDDSAKSFLSELNSEELAVTVDFIESDNADFASVLQNYKDVLSEAEDAGVDFSKTVYGNIDTNARHVLEWTGENLKKYKEELMSWEDADASWDDVKKNLEGSISTVMGGAETFEIDGKMVDIAFSPMLQTESGVEVLSKDTVGAYINNIIAKATEDEKWDKEELLKLDAEGIEVDGQKIKGILADVGETAIATSEQMHFVGKDGALALAEAEITSLIEEQAKINEAMSFKPDIAVDTESIEAFNEVLAESATAAGLSSEAIDSLKAKYSDLDSYDPATLFERTGNGIKVNREELAKLNKEQQEATQTEVQEHIDTLAEAYNNNAAEIDKCTNAAERAQLIAKGETYKSKIEELAEYQAQLEGVTGAYQRWINAQDSPQNYEGYQAVATSREDVEDEISRGFISNATKEYIDLLSGEDLVGGTIDDYAEAWENLDKKVGSTSYSIHDFFTVNDDGDITATGIDRFFKGLQQDFKGSVAEFNDKSGKWEYDFSQENLQKIQDEWGMGIEAIELMLEAAVDAGYDVDWGSVLDGIDIDTAGFETLISLAETAQKEFNKIEGLEDVNFNFAATGLEEATDEVEKARQAFSQFINEDGTVNLEAEGAEQMQVMFTTLLLQKQQLATPSIMKVDTSQLDESQDKISEVITAAQGLQTALENYEVAISTGVDVEKAKKDLNTAISTLEGTDADIRADLKLPSNEELQSAANGLGKIKVGATLDGTAVGDLESKIQNECTPEVIAKVTGLNEEAIQNGSKQITYTAEHSDVDNFINGLTDISKKIIYTYTTEGTKPKPENIEKTITYKYEVEGTPPKAYGTAHAGGSASGMAFARGNWGINGNGTALGGELGRKNLRPYTVMCIKKSI